MKLPVQLTRNTYHPVKQAVFACGRWYERCCHFIGEWRYFWHELTFLVSYQSKWLQYYICSRRRKTTFNRYRFGWLSTEVTLRRCSSLQMLRHSHWSQSYYYDRMFEWTTANWMMEKSIRETENNVRKISLTESSRINWFLISSQFRQ